MGNGNSADREFIVQLETQELMGNLKKLGSVLREIRNDLLTAGNADLAHKVEGTITGIERQEQHTFALAYTVIKAREALMEEQTQFKKRRKEELQKIKYAHAKALADMRAQHILDSASARDASAAIAAGLRADMSTFQTTMRDRIQADETRLNTEMDRHRMQEARLQTALTDARSALDAIEARHHVETQQLRHTHAADLERLRLQHQEAQATHQREITRLEAASGSHDVTAEMRTLWEAQITALSAERVQLQSEHASALARVQAFSDNALSLLREVHQEARADAAERIKELSTERSAHTAALEQARAELVQLQSRFDVATAEIARMHQERADLIAAHTAEDTAHAAALADLERQYAEERDGLMAREIDLTEQIGVLTARNQGLSRTMQEQTAVIQTQQAQHAYFEQQITDAGGVPDLLPDYQALVASRLIERLGVLEPGPVNNVQRFLELAGGAIIARNQREGIVTTFTRLIDFLRADGHLAVTAETSPEALADAIVGSSLLEPGQAVPLRTLLTLVDADVSRAAVLRRIQVLAEEHTRHFDRMNAWMDGHFTTAEVREQIFGVSENATNEEVLNAAYALLHGSDHPDPNAVGRIMLSDFMNSITTRVGIAEPMEPELFREHAIDTFVAVQNLNHAIQALRTQAQNREEELRVKDERDRAAFRNLQETENAARRELEQKLQAQAEKSTAQEARAVEQEARVVEQEARVVEQEARAAEQAARIVEQEARVVEQAATAQHQAQQIEALTRQLTMLAGLIAPQSRAGSAFVPGPAAPGVAADTPQAPLAQEPATYVVREPRGAETPTPTPERPETPVSGTAPVSVDTQEGSEEIDQVCREPQPIARF